MSQMTAGARVAFRPHRASSAEGRALRVIRGTVDRPRGGVFAAICLALLVGGFLLVLVLNTAMAKGSFVLDDLQTRSGALADEQDGLNAAIDAQSAPAALAQRALRLGMVPSTTAAFLDLSDGRVLGVAKAAQKVPGFTVITSPTPVPPKKKPAGKTTVTTKGTVTTTTVVTPKANGVVQTVATSVDAKDGHAVVVTTVVTPDRKDKAVTRTMRTSVDSATRTATVRTTVATKAVGTTPASETTTTTTRPATAAERAQLAKAVAAAHRAATAKPTAKPTTAKPTTSATATTRTTTSR